MYFNCASFLMQMDHRLARFNTERP